MSDLVLEEWRKKTLSDLITLQYGKSPNAVKTETGDYPIIGTGGVNGYASTFLHEGNTTVVGRKGSINKPIFINERFWATDTTYIATAYKATDPKWLYYCLQNTDLSKYNEASGVPSLNRDTLYAIPFMLPPLPEQQKIAAILSSVDEVIEKTQAQIGKLKDLKTGMMQELLTKGIGHTEFKDSPVGRIPVGWEVVTFSEIFVDYKYGPRFSSKDYKENGNVKTIRGTDVESSGEIHYQQVPTAQIDEKTVENHKLKNGDLVIITTADCGASAVFREQPVPFIASAYAIKLTPTQKVSPDFIRFFMQTERASKQIESFIRKGTVANLPGSDVMMIKLALPPLNEQVKIAEILIAVENNISELISKKSSIQSIKKALMQDLLTGKVRVNHESTEAALD